MEQSYNLHHIGCAVRDIEKAKKYYIDFLGYNLCGTIEENEINLKACFLWKDNHYLELVESIDKSKKSIIDKVVRILGGGVYHQCYEVENLKMAIREFEEKGFVRYQRKFNENQYMRYIYMITPDNYLIELLEKLKEF
ncbi:VOC family protein [Clostridium bornimense]|uniref:VOC family protein n=1 Tax=Clostridium bornimense TaxID=1216932 RepID=UPI001C0FFCB9|nr:VOC family protein [Clostridium bornimense]MBU5317321.1 VOC family protein [Clostridium bornimense]